MASFGRLTISGITGTNENSLTLANISLDFSLLKIIPPREFLEVGNSLSTFRKQEAEEGRINQTARKLGALFEPIVPPTPRLLRSHGRRASEIAQSAASSAPKAQGLFKKQPGIDGTSIWAAATSSSGALQEFELAALPIAELLNQTSHAEPRVQELESLGGVVLFIEDEPLETLEKFSDIRTVWGKPNEMNETESLTIGRRRGAVAESTSALK
ncbi:hypothetical protein BU26DRAFT_559219 [Trematosphaeria pertusa]|uniref:Uncharacterized protein n=1 Tax=Trematosphaeria pertusa TaxID=390896 RepID=A0A6A6IVF0_9PLEO|nr:uncharacterized protein BU26DRAFT_559219 [Trematosphaeria pertusa]KAF2254545.1 hypothetical protein BU26DRAFT_559219 [Trematosphaeria pertusa]